MNFAGLLIGSRLRSFMDMVDVYRDLCREGKISVEDMKKAFVATWGDRMKEWGWDTEEFLSVLSEFK